MLREGGEGERAFSQTQLDFFRRGEGGKKGYFFMCLGGEEMRITTVKLGQSRQKFIKQFVALRSNVLSGKPEFFFSSLFHSQKIWGGKKRTIFTTMKISDNLIFLSFATRLFPE